MRLRGGLSLFARVSSYAEEVRSERGALHAKMRRDIGEDTREGADTEARVIRDGDVMLAPLLGREPQVTPGLARHRVAVAAERVREISARDIAREPHHLGGDDFVVDQMESDRLRSLGILVEVTAHGIAHHLSQALQIIRLGEDSCAQSTSGVAPFRRVFDEKD